jgi:hypothetical protein
MRLLARIALALQAPCLGFGRLRVRSQDLVIPRICCDRNSCYQ